MGRGDGDVIPRRVGVQAHVGSVAVVRAEREGVEPHAAGEQVERLAAVADPRDVAGAAPGRGVAKPVERAVPVAGARGVPEAISTPCSKNGC